MLLLLLLIVVVIALTKIQIAILEEETFQVLQQNDISVLGDSYTKAISVVGLFYIALSIIANTGIELSSGTLRKNLIDGMSRLDFFLAKLGSIIIHILAILIIALISYTVLVFTSGYESLLMESTVWRQIGSLITVFFAYGLIGLFFGVLFKEAVRASVAFFLYRFFEKVLLTLDEKQWHIGVTNYLPINIIDKAIELSSLAWPVTTLLVLYLSLITSLTYFFLSKLNA